MCFLYRYPYSGARLSFFVKFILFSSLLIAITLAIGHFLFPNEDGVAVDASGNEPMITVVIDAGHGGRDGGAVADDDGTLEKHLNLSVAKKLKALLESANVRVLMTRETDVELASPDSPHKKQDDLNARLEIAETYDDAIFVSIHMNKFPVSKYSGLQVYYSDNHADSRELAQIIQGGAAELLKNTGEREIKSAGDAIYLMSNLEIPAVLVECGFLSNYEEKELLKTDDYQKKLAMSIFSSILNYISEHHGITENK